MDSESDVSLQDNELQSRYLPSSLQQSPLNTDSSDLADDAAGFELARRIQKKVEATLNVQVLKVRQETRELHYKLAEELKASMAREAALKQRVKTLELNNPEAKMQADALRDQTRLAERRRRRCRALRQQLQRMYRAEKKKVVHDYTRIVLDRMASHCEPGGKVLMSMEFDGKHCCKWDNGC